MNTRRANPRPARNRHSERGLTLIEALVAITVFAVVFIAALTLYSVASSAYLRTDSAVIQQQNVRFSMDRMTETLRDAGSGYNTLGAKNLADEQIEGAWQSAVFVRGDFDGLRETALENAAFPIVTIGNDEIVGFVLLKNGTGTLPIQVKTDLTGSGRDAILTNATTIANEETVTINVAARTLLEQTNPPYQLARVTFAGATPKYEIIADNINQLRFEYLPATGTVPVFDFAAAPNSGSGADTERDERTLIRKINVRLAGMTDRPDMSYKTATGQRTFTLEQAILPPALGIIGGRHELIPAASLPAPNYVTACTGHCRQHLIRWPSAGTGIYSYQILITAPAATGPNGTVGPFSFPATTSGGALQYVFQDPAADIAAGVTRQFTFKVAPTSGGALGPYTPAVSMTAQNDANSTPADVQGVDASAAPGENALLVTWTPVTQNIAAVTATGLCDSAGSGSAGNTPPSTWNIDMSDLSNAKVYRDRVAAATTDISSLTVGALVNVPSQGQFIDRHAAPCESYFYRVKACDLCDVKSAGFSPAMAAARSYTPDPGVLPGVPTGLRAGGMIGSTAGNFVFDLVWNPVLTTAAGSPAAVSHYRIERSSRVGATGMYSTPEEINVDDATQSAQSVPMTNADAQALQWRYQVRAIYDCSPAREGDRSTEYLVTCTPGNGVSLDTTLPASGDVFVRPGQGLVPLELTAVGTGYAGAEIFVKSSTTTIHSASLTGVPTLGKYTFPSLPIDTTSIPDGFYTVEGYATVNGCRIAAPPVVFEIDSIACGQRIVQATYLGTGNNTAKSMSFRIENTCQNAVTISAFTPTWTGALAATIKQVSIGTINHYNSGIGILSGGTMPLSPPITLTAGSVFTASLSPLITFTFSTNFTSTNNQSGIPAKFSSIFASVTSPTPAVEEQLVDGANIP